MGLAMAGLVSSYGQGTVNFANLGSGGLNAPVFDVGGTTKLGSGFMAQLWAGAGAASLAPVGTATSFLNATPPNGFFNGGVVTVASVAPNATGFFQVYAWDSVGGTLNSYAAALAAGAKRGFGNVFSVATGGGGVPAGPPATLVGMQSFNLVPEPSTLVLGALGAVALLFRRRK